MNLFKIIAVVQLCLYALGLQAQNSVDLNSNGKIDIYEDHNRSIDERVVDAISQMTLEEKVNMLTRNSSSWYYSGCERLGIPEFSCHDGPHGVRDYRNEFSTAFPTTVARGAAFDRNLSYRLGVAEGKEFLAQGWDMRLGNCVDLNRHPLYGRASESAGEDPYLCAEIGVANVLGTQSTGCIANLKHLILNTREDPSIRKDNHAVIDERSLVEMYGYPFKESIQRGNAWSVMTAHSRVNGLRSSESPYVLNTVLRDYFAFRYFVLNDWSSVNDALKSPDVTVADVFNAGHDLETNTSNYQQDLLAEVLSGNVQEERLDEAVARVLRVLIISGIVDGRTVGDPADKGRSAHIELALEGARKSLVLLKNDHEILPIRKSGTIALIGPNAAVLPWDAGGSSTVRPPYTISVMEGISQVAPGVSMRYNRGCDINTTDRGGFEGAVAEAKAAEYVVYVGGLDRTQEGESKDRLSGSVQLPGVQQELINALSQVNPNLVVVLISGGICALNECIDNVDGLIYSFYGGQVAGQAIAEALFGDYNPGGKLPVTMPKTDSQLAPFTDDHNDHIIRVGYRWFDSQELEPQFAFGHGLSYTHFQYSNLRLSEQEIDAEEGLVAKVDVTNTGERSGDEVVQLYLKDEKASVKMARKQLKGFERIKLLPGQTKTIQFKINAQDLAWWNESSSCYFVEAGEFSIMVGGASDRLPLMDRFKVTGDYFVPRPEPMEEVIFVSEDENEAQLRAAANTLLRVEAEAYDDGSGKLEIIEKGEDTDGKALAVYDGDWICFREIDLGSWLNFIDLHYRLVTGHTTIELRLDSPEGTLFGKHRTDNQNRSKGWIKESIGTSQYSISGVHDVYMVFRGREGRLHQPVCILDWWEVEGQRKSNNTDQNPGYTFGQGKLEASIIELPRNIRASLNKMYPEYVVWKPSEIRPGDNLPLLIYLHGGGKTKKAVETLKGGIHPAKYWREQDADFPFIIVGPHSSGPWNIDDLELFYEHILKTQAVDNSRIYLCGYSMGGAGTWNWAQAHPEHFAAIVPFAGGLGDGGPKNITEHIDAWQENLKDMPAWIIHGADDTTVPAERSRLMYAGLKEKGNKLVKLTILEGKGHAITGHFQTMPEIYEWLLNFDRNSR
jgi:beta-glucosidase